MARDRGPSLLPASTTLKVIFPTEIASDFSQRNRSRPTGRQPWVFTASLSKRNSAASSTRYSSHLFSDVSVKSGPRAPANRLPGTRSVTKADGPGTSIRRPLLKLAELFCYFCKYLLLHSLLYARAVLIA